MKPEFMDDYLKRMESNWVTCMEAVKEKDWVAIRDELRDLVQYINDLLDHPLFMS